MRMRKLLKSDRKVSVRLGVIYFMLLTNILFSQGGVVDPWSFPNYLANHLSEARQALTDVRQKAEEIQKLKQLIDQVNQLRKQGELTGFILDQAGFEEFDSVDWKDLDSIDGALGASIDGLNSINSLARLNEFLEKRDEVKLAKWRARYGEQKGYPKKYTELLEIEVDEGKIYKEIFFPEDDKKDFWKNLKKKALDYIDPFGNDGNNDKSKNSYKTKIYKSIIEGTVVDPNLPKDIQKLEKSILAASLKGDDPIKAIDDKILNSGSQYSRAAGEFERAKENAKDGLVVVPTESLYKKTTHDYFKEKRLELFYQKEIEGLSLQIRNKKSSVQKLNEIKKPDDLTQVTDSSTNKSIIIYQEQVKKKENLQTEIKALEIQKSDIETNLKAVNKKIVRYVERLQKLKSIKDRE